MVSRRRNLIAWIFLAPNASGFLVFTFLPVIAALALSLFSWDLFHPPRFVGLQNFARLLGWYSDAGGWHFSDPNFWKYLGNTLFLMLGIPFAMAASLGLALLLNQPLRARAFFRAVFFLPHISAGVGLYLLWCYLYNEQFGLINRALGLCGVSGPGWLSSIAWAKPALIIMNVWLEMGGIGLIIFLAALQGIPRELLEAAEVDGAGPWARFRHITWPLLAPATFFILVTSVIRGFQSGFNVAYVMTGGGPAGATTTVDYYIFSHAFQYFNMGYAAAVAVVLFVLILAVTLVFWRWGGRGTQYV